MEAAVLTSEDYKVPPWSVEPTGDYLLEVIKDGSMIQELPLPKKQFILIGKMAGLCDVVLENMSVSRKHAVIQFKADDPHPYLYDLGSTHGTLVNQRKLPSRVYHKLNEYDTIVFAQSTRKYVLRSPQLAEKDDISSKSNEDETDFQRMLRKQNEIGLSKEELKDKYMEMLENDPYYKSSLNLGRKFEGKKQNEEEGVNWGISDEYEVYAYRNQNDYPLEPEILRRLPGLDSTLLSKVAEYQEKLHNYQQAEGELRDLANRQQREFGLEEKARNKKQGLEKRTVEMSEEVQKIQDYIKTNLFGEASTRNMKHQKRQKQTDTYQNDQFFDRTLEKKQQLNLNTLRQAEQGDTTEDYWRVKKCLEEFLLKRKQLSKQLLDSATQTQTIPEQEQDEFEKYMNSTEKTLKEETRAQLIEKMKINDQAIEIYKSKLQRIRPLERVDSSMMFETQVQTQQNKGENKSSVSAVITKIHTLKEQKVDIDEQDEAIFKYYENGNKNICSAAKQQDRLKRSYKQHLQSIAASQEQQEKQSTQDPGPSKRPHRYEPRNLPKVDQQEQFIDITKKFK